MSDTAAQAPPLPSRWDQNASFWVQIIRENRDKYRTKLTDPAVLEAIGQSEGLAVLDAGCGEGYLSRILAGKGATVTGIGGCPESRGTSAAAQVIIRPRSPSHDCLWH